MLSKEAFKMIVAATTLKTGLNQEELATGMGYGRNYISEMLSPTGKLSLKFVRAFQLKYGDLENPNKGSIKKEAGADPLEIIANLTESNRMLAEANLILANKINSGAPVAASSSSRMKGKVSSDPTEQMQPGKQETGSEGRKKQKDSVQH